jgi:hypothetical protein
MNRLRTTALGSQVLKVDRQLSLAEAQAAARRTSPPAIRMSNKPEP